MIGSWSDTMSFFQLDIFLALQAKVVQCFMNALQGVIVAMIDVSQLCLASDRHLFCLVLTLLEMVITVFLYFLKQSADYCFLLFPEGLQAKFNNFEVSYLFLSQFSGFYFFYFCLDEGGLIVLLHFDQISR